MNRCRFAPSPTGLLHVGGARTALFNLLFARSTGGRFVLRIEDTDRQRSTRTAERAILDDLAWLGIAWDEGPGRGGEHGPYRQSERLARYREVVDRLVARELAYRAWESPEELDALRRAAPGGALRYRGGPRPPEEEARLAAEGRRAVVRFRSPGREVAFTDLVLGEVVVPAEELDDFVLLKADGFPTYHLAVVVDDHDMAITHVLRAQEHLKNTARHLLLYEALGWTPPEHGHMPLILSMGGSKLSKRDKAREARRAARESGLDATALAARAGLSVERVEPFLAGRTDEVATAEAVAAALGAALPEIDVVDFRRAGYLPEALVNFLALLGWSPGDDRERMTFEELVAAFSLERVGRTAARFDREKLRWMNGAVMRELERGELLARLLAWAGEQGHPIAGRPRDWVATAVDLYAERAATLRELADAAMALLARPRSWGPPRAVRKHLLEGGGLEALELALGALRGLERWEAGAIEAAFGGLAEAHREGRLGRIAQPVRIAVTGGPVSPPIGGTLVLVGREETLARLEACLAHHRAAPGAG